MKNKDEIRKYFNNRYYNKENNYQAIVSNILKSQNNNKFLGLYKIITTAIISLLGTTGIAFASVQIYNNYIKKHEEIDSNSLYLNADGLYSYDFTKNMTYDESTDLYYKVINNIDEYNNYKNMSSTLPKMLEEDFSNNYLILIGNWGARNPHETDLIISNVDADSTTTYIMLKQKNNPNYDKTMITLYAIVDKQSLRPNIKLTINNFEIQQKDYNKLSDLPDTYSLDDAEKDGCFVIKDYKVISKNKNSLDDFINNAKNNVESFIRIYSCNNNKVKIIDIQYKNNIYTAQVRSSESPDIYGFSFKYLTKKELSENNTYEYGYNDVDRSKDAGYLLKVCYD